MRSSVLLVVMVAGCKAASSTSTATSTSTAPSTATTTSMTATTSSTQAANTEAGTGAAADAATVDYVTYTNPKFSFSVDVPSFFVKGPADGDGRGQPWSWRGKATMRAWGMYNSPVMTKEALFGDWTRRPGILTKEAHDDWWLVTAKDGPTKLWYSKSYLDGGVITTAELTYDASLKDEFAPILEHIGSSLRAGHKG